MLDLIEYPSSILNEQCDDVSVFDAGLRSFVDNMVEAMYASGGVGLAAPQVGSSLRIAIIDPSGGEEANRLVTLINPRVTWRSSEEALGEEGCLSLPGVTLQVPRSLSVRVDYDDAAGSHHSMALDKQVARIAQHEIDHLDGIVMLDRVSSLTRRMALKDMRKAGGANVTH